MTAKHAYTFCVFNRNLGSRREDATLEERAEQVLYFAPERTDTLEMVRTIETLQAFIDLSALLPQLGATDTIHSVRLTDMRYALLEVEDGIYFALGLSPLEPESDSSFLRLFSSSDTSKDPLPSEDAMRAMLRRIWFLSKPLLGARLQLNSDFARRFFQHFLPRLFQIPPYSNSPMSSACTMVLACDSVEMLDPVITPEEYIRVVKFVESLKLNSPCFVDRSVVFLREGAIAYSQLANEDTRFIAVLINFAFGSQEAWQDKGIGLLGHMLILESERQASHNDSRAKAIRVTLPNRHDCLRLAVLRGGNGNCLSVLLRDGEDSEDEEKAITKALSEFQIAAAPLYSIRFSATFQDFPRSLLKAPRTSVMEYDTSNAVILKNKLDVIDSSGFFAVDLYRKVIVANEKFIEPIGRPCRLPEVISAKTMPPSLVVALDVSWLHLYNEVDLAFSFVCDGDWFVASIKSHNKMYFRVSRLSAGGMLTPFSSAEVYKKMPLELNRLESELDCIIWSYNI